MLSQPHHQARREANQTSSHPSTDKKVVAQRTHVSHPRSEAWSRLWQKCPREDYSFFLLGSLATSTVLSTDLDTQVDGNSKNDLRSGAKMTCFAVVAEHPTSIIDSGGKPRSVYI